MTGSGRRIMTLIAVVVAAASFIPVAAAKSGDVVAYPTLYVKYNMNCTFAIFDDNDHRVNSIPPGTYQIEVSTPIMFKLVVPGGVGVDNIAPNDFTGCKGWVQFQLTGPGVEVFTTLDSGCDAFLLLPAQTFKANSTYILQDLNQPAATRTPLTVESAGTPLTPKSPYGQTSGKGDVIKDLFGSGIVAIKGTLTGTLSLGGKTTLTTKGKPVTSLKAGKYRFKITDQDPTRSFTIQAVTGEAAKGKTKDLSAAKFVGKHSTGVTLKPGKWMYFSGSGHPQYFTVT
jgi:hypothetical protein